MERARKSACGEIGPIMEPSGRERVIASQNKSDGNVRSRQTFMPCRRATFRRFSTMRSSVPVPNLV
jgi:hypothetical protein